MPGPPPCRPDFHVPIPASSQNLAAVPRALSALLEHDDVVLHSFCCDVSEIDVLRSRGSGVHAPAAGSMSPAAFPTRRPARRPQCEAERVSRYDSGACMTIIFWFKHGQARRRLSTRVSAQGRDRQQVHPAAVIVAVGTKPKPLDPGSHPSNLARVTKQVLSGLPTACDFVGTDTGMVAARVLRTRLLELPPPRGPQGTLGSSQSGPVPHPLTARTGP